MHLVIIGAGEFQKPIIEKANEMSSLLQNV